MPSTERERRFARLMDLPSETVMNTALITVVGSINHHYRHRGSLNIQLLWSGLTPSGTIVVSRKGLVIEYLSSDELKLGGRSQA